MAKKKIVPMPEKTDEATESLFSGLPAEVFESLHPAKMRTILLYMTGQYSQKKIASIVGVSETTIRIWLMDKSIQAVIKELQQREFAIIDSQLKALRYKAIDTMNELLDSTMDNVRFQAAKDILDRGGHKPQQAIKIDKTVTTVEQQLASLADFTISEDDIVDIDVYDIINGSDEDEQEGND